MSLKSLAMGLRQAGGIISPDVAKQIASEDAELRGQDRQETLLRLRQTLEQEAQRASPQYQLQQETLRKQKAYEAAVAQSGGDMSKIAQAGLQFGKPEVAINVLDRQEARKTALEQRQFEFEQRQQQADRDHKLALERLTDQRQRDAATAEYQKQSLVLRAQGQRLQTELAKGNQEISKLRLDLAIQQKMVEKPLNEFQGKNVLFGSRAAVADSILNGLEGDAGTVALATKQKMGAVPLVGGVLEAGANLALSDDQQRVEQAQRDFVNAVLRQESGAVISDQEFANAKRQYFPQPGDSKEVINQKRRNRQTAIMGFRRLAGPGSSTIDDIMKEQGFKPKPKAGATETKDIPAPPPGFKVDGA